MNRIDFYRHHLVSAAAALDLPLTPRQVHQLADLLAEQIAAIAKKRAPTTARLSPMAATVLLAIAAGETSQQTAQRLCLSEDTIKTHKRRLYRRLGATSAAQAVFNAIGQGLLDPGRGGAACPGGAKGDV